jgi:hypothetical protein
MLCKISRWMISRADDTGKKLPRMAERHVGRCRACGEFARLSASLATRLRGERAAWLAQVPEFPWGLETRAEAATERPRAGEPGRSRPARPWFALRPLPAAAAALVIVAAAVVLFRVIPREAPPTAQDRVAARAALRTFTTAADRLPAAVTEAESLLEKERRILERSISSAAEYVQARLNIRIERKEAPKSL